MSRLTITLKEPAQSQAFAALVERGLVPEGAEYYGPVFEGWLNWGTDEWSVWVAVYANKDDHANYKPPTATYYYPLVDVARLKFEQVTE